MVLIVTTTEKYERPLTIEEQCMTTVTLDDDYNDNYRHAVMDELKSRHYIDRKFDKYDKMGVPRFTGIFSKTTTRPATENESRAYHYLKMIGLNDGTDKVCTDIMHSCDGCIFHDACPTLMSRYTKAKDEIQGLKFFEKED